MKANRQGNFEYFVKQEEQLQEFERYVPVIGGGTGFDAQQNRSALGLVGHRVSQRAVVNLTVCLELEKARGLRDLIKSWLATNYSFRPGE